MKTAIALPDEPLIAAEGSALPRSLVVGGGARPWSPGVGVADRLARLAADRGIQGARIFDLQIALPAIENGAREIWTHDGSGLSLPGLGVRDPLR
jgi:hypothetical protein